MNYDSLERVTVFCIILSRLASEPSLLSHLECVCAEAPGKANSIYFLNHWTWQN